MRIPLRALWTPRFAPAHVSPKSAQATIDSNRAQPLRPPTTRLRRFHFTHEIWVEAEADAKTIALTR